MPGNEVCDADNLGELMFRVQSNFWQLDWRRLLISAEMLSQTAHLHQLHSWAVQQESSGWRQ